MTTPTGNATLQAGAERLDLLTELKVRTDALSKAAGNRSKVRSDPSADNAVQGLEETWKGAQEKSVSIFQTEEEKIVRVYERFAEGQSKALAAAIQKQEDSIAAITVAHSARVEVALVAHEAAVAEVRSNQQERDRTVSTEAHLAEKAVHEQAQAVESQRSKAQKDLGIDLAAFVNLPEA